MDQSEVIAIIEEATHQRGWISNSYAQIEYLLGDLILRAREFPIYAEQTGAFTHSAPKRARKVRAMLAVDGPLSTYSDQLTLLLDKFEANHDVRNLLAHGFCEFHFTPDGDAGLVFRKFERGHADHGAANDILIQRTFRLSDMYYHKEQFVSQAQSAIELFAQIHFDLGWGELDPASFQDGWTQV